MTAADVTQLEMETAMAETVMEMVVTDVDLMEEDPDVEMAMVVTVMAVMEMVVTEMEMEMVVTDVDLTEKDPDVEMAMAVTETAAMEMVETEMGMEMVVTDVDLMEEDPDVEMAMAVTEMDMTTEMVVTEMVVTEMEMAMVVTDVDRMEKDPDVVYQAVILLDHTVHRYSGLTSTQEVVVVPMEKAPDVGALLKAWFFLKFIISRVTQMAHILIKRIAVLIV